MSLETAKADTPPLGDDLFGDTPPARVRSENAIPLAERLRPSRLSQVIGQPHLLGPGMPLCLAFESGRLHSMILWGPPGVGKTTLARLAAQHFQADFIPVSAVLAGIKEIREAIERARINRQAGRRTLLFVDEVHRFNKAQQDAFLPHVESGLITFIGATTENPSFEVVGALLSRTQVYVLRSLTDEELAALLDRALAQQDAAITLDDAARSLLLGNADGDARRLLNMVEQLGIAAQATGRSHIDSDFCSQTLAPARRRFDKGGDQFYDQISALHKAVRGSHPDAALYWLARMLDGGADPLYIGRRLIRMASEDIGLADPRAHTLALEAVAVYERLGSPEGELALAQAVTYLAVAAKSNAVYRAWNDAQALVKATGTLPVPEHLRNAPTRLMKDLGHGQGYRYAHDEPQGYAAGSSYLPAGLQVQFYRPTDRGLEQRIGERLASLRELDQKADS
ncbi:MAG: replication-associated recombination protein A [Betaproteobacteria bacterium]|nr:replication-associated recombination protein A [Betaproteobacteria bacterium]